MIIQTKMFFFEKKHLKFPEHCAILVTKIRNTKGKMNNKKTMASFLPAAMERRYEWRFFYLFVFYLEKINEKN